MAAQAKHHDYHLVDPSPWPVVGSISAFIMAVGAIAWMKRLNRRAEQRLGLQPGSSRAGLPNSPPAPPEGAIATGSGRGADA